MNAPLLEVERLAIEFRSQGRTLRAVDDVSLGLEAGATLGIVGESGCGKTATALAIMGLLQRPAARIATGSIRFDGTDLRRLPERRLRRLRGAGMAMVFQDAMAALNPVYSIGRQIGDVLSRHAGAGRRARRRRTIELLERVGIPLPAQRLDCYPHELSGGMRQRVMIAMALACRPKLLIADEPTTALDVTTQAQVLEQIRTLQRDFGTAVLLVTHDLGVIAETCDRAAVMYCGRIVETAPVRRLFAAPRHRYTEALLASAPRLRPEPLARLPVIPGTVPPPGALPSGCRFAPRCGHASERCRSRQPVLERVGDGRVACFHPAGGDAG
jgi:oligopeptide/dipeptide ABC transporter ATP-binding protein